MIGVLPSHAGPHRPHLWLIAGLLLCPILGSGPAAAQQPAIGDTLTVIQRPLPNIPTLVTPGSTFTIHCEAAAATTGWAAELHHGSKTVPLDLATAAYDPATLWWTLTVDLPAVPIHELYDLQISADGGIEDVARQAVQVVSAFKDDYYFVHITDPHLPDHQFSSDGADPADSTEMDDMRAVIEDLNLIRPEFVLLTGDIVNEGELEDYLEWRSYTRTQRLFEELQVPVYFVAGNHDIGGWDATAPEDGTARREWWRFFGWRRLDDPPPGASWRTQNYSFDYGPVHFVGLESYINYDDWRWPYYGGESFTDGQLQWLDGDLSAAAASSAAQVLFYHFDFSSQLDLNSLGVEMALYGHIHRNDGSLTVQPYELATNNVSDGERAYRLIRVFGTTLQPRATLAAGVSGQNLRVQYEPANDGTHDEVTAEIINQTSERFEHGLLQIQMPQPASDYLVDGGTLTQVDDSAEVAVCYVAVDIFPNATRTVTITRSATSVASELAGRPHIRLDAIHPNPFNPTTELTYSLSRAAAVQLGLYDLQGRQVALLVDGVMPAGEHRLRWDGRDQRGRASPSGIYVVRLTSGGETATRKIVLAR